MRARRLQCGGDARVREPANSCTGLRSMSAQELQCVGGACMRVHASTCEWENPFRILEWDADTACQYQDGMQAHASEIRSAGAKQSGQSSRAGWNRPAAEKRKDGWHPHAECDGGCMPCGPGAARRARNSCLPDGSDGAFKTMMAKLLSQKLHRTVHAVVGCKHLGDRSGDCNLSRTL